MKNFTFKYIVIGFVCLLLLSRLGSILLWFEDCFSNLDVAFPKDAQVAIAVMSLIALVVMIFRTMTPEK
jgi:hypothetical protein